MGDYTEWAKSRYTEGAILYTVYLLLAHSVNYLRNIAFRGGP